MYGAVSPIFVPVLNSSKVSTQFSRNGASCVALYVASFKISSTSPIKG